MMEKIWEVYLVDLWKINNGDTCLDDGMTCIGVFDSETLAKVKAADILMKLAHDISNWSHYAVSVVYEEIGRVTNTLNMDKLKELGIKMG